MVSFTFTTMALAFTTLTSALPSHPRDTAQSLSLIADGYPTLSLVAQQSSVLGNLDLVFQRPSAYPGTPAYLNDTMLDFNYSGTYPGIYSMHYEPVGDNYGYSVPATAIFGNDNAATGLYQGTDGTLQPTMTAALQHFFACNSKIDGEDILALRFGVFNANGTAPEGCVSASLVLA